MKFKIIVAWYDLWVGAFWDKKNKILTLARDRYGIKPLYTWQNNDVFMFASEIKAFLKHPQFKMDVNYKTLSQKLPIPLLIV